MTAVLSAPLFLDPQRLLCPVSSWASSPGALMEGQSCTRPRPPLEWMCTNSPPASIMCWALLRVEAPADAKASPGGGQIVYAVRDSSGWAHTYVVDTTTRTVREIKATRAEPIFLTSRYIWYRGESACTEADFCGPQPPFHPSSGKTYVYDLQEGTETESVITSVIDVFPGAA